MSENKNQMVTVIFPDGKKIYTEKLALVGLNAGQDGPPVEGQNVAMVYGKFSLDEMVHMHQNINEALMQAGQALVEKMEKDQGPKAVMDFMMDKISDAIVNQMVKDPEVLRSLLRVVK